MTPAAVLVLMHALAPHTPDARIAPIAEAIAGVAADDREAAELVVLSFVETTFGRAGKPMGLSCCYRRGMTIGDAVARAAALLRDSRAACGASTSRRMGFYRTGRRVADGESDRRERMVRRVARVALRRE